MSILRNIGMAVVLTTCGGVRAATIQVGLVDLTEDTEITVAAGDRYEICTLSASDVHTLTKRGEGDLYIGRVTSTNPRVDLQGGRLFVGPKLTKPAVFETAAFHVDANVMESLTKFETDDKTYVSKWADVNGGAHYASNSTSGRQPWLGTLDNGNVILNFGSLKNSTEAGVGGYLLFDNKISGIRAAFCVQKFLEETIDAPKGDCSHGLSGYDQCVFTPEAKPEGSGPSYANKWQGFTKQVRAANDESGLGGSISVNGKALSTVSKLASGDLEVVDYKIVDPEFGGTDYGFADRFAGSFWDRSFGGMLIGEVAIFTTALTDEQHALLSHYLMVKWIGYGIPFADQITVGAGTCAAIWNGSSYDVIEYKEPNVFQAELNVMEDKTVQVNAGVTNEVYVLKGGAHTLTKTGPGVLKIVQVETTDLTLDIQGGEVLFDDPSAPGSFFRDAVLWLDADNPATRETEAEADRTLVSRWNDSNGGTMYATAGTAAPYLTKADGRTFMDFGSVKNGSLSPAGYGGSFSLSSVVKPFREVFAVVRPNEELYSLSNVQIAPVGSSWDWSAFLPGSNDANKYPFIINVYQEATKQLQKGVYVDGQKGVESGSGQMWLAGIHVYDFRLDEPENVGLSSDKAMADALGNDRGVNFGGFRMGEMVIFPRQLSVDARALTEAYLSVKWRARAKSFKFAKIKTTAGGILTIANGAKVTTGDIDARTGLNVQSGTFVMDPLSIGTSLRFDAGDATTYETSESGEKALVTRWNDANGGATYATADTVAPYLTEDDGRTYVDFGSVFNATHETAKDGYGGRMSLSAEQKGFRETFSVVRPSDELCPVAGPVIQPFGGSSWTVFKPGFNYANHWPSIINRYQPEGSQLKSGIYVDGIPGSTVNDGQEWLAGVHVYNFRLLDWQDTTLTYENAIFTKLGANGTSNYGGFRLGEMIVYPKQLSETERARCQQTLMAKWMGVPGYTQQVESVTVAAGAQVKIAHVNVEIDGTLALAGTLEVQSVKAAVLKPTSASAAVKGTLDLSEPGVVMIDRALYGDVLDEGYVRVLAASSVVGDAKAWRVESTTDKPLKLRAKADGLYATGLIKGLSVIIR